MKRLILLVLFLGLLTVGSRTAEAGPPCLCWEFEIGDHKTIPLGKDLILVKGFGAQRAAAATLKLLRPEMPGPVRMETLRRATLYVQDDAATANGLLMRLMARALTAEAKPDNFRNLAWFDAAYLLACYHEAGIARDIDEYPWLERAIDETKNPAQLHFGAAVVTLMGDHPNHDRYAHHIKEAEKGAGTHPLLRANLVIHSKRAGAVLEYFRRKKAAAGKQKDG